jgi:hypothetical protein
VRARVLKRSAKLLGRDLTLAQEDVSDPVSSSRRGTRH